MIFSKASSFLASLKTMLASFFRSIFPLVKIPFLKEKSPLRYTFDLFLEGGGQSDRNEVCMLHASLECGKLRSFLMRRHQLSLFPSMLALSPIFSNSNVDSKGNREGLDIFHDRLDDFLCLWDVFLREFKN